MVTPTFKKGQKEGAKEQQTSQPHFDPWEGDGTTNSGKLSWAHEGQEGDVE